jgi:hypothetical protein
MKILTANQARELREKYIKKEALELDNILDIIYSRIEEKAICGARFFNLSRLKEFNNLTRENKKKITQTLTQCGYTINSACEHVFVEWSV